MAQNFVHTNLQRTLLWFLPIFFTKYARNTMHMFTEHCSGLEQGRVRISNIVSFPVFSFLHSVLCILFSRFSYLVLFFIFRFLFLVSCFLAPVFLLPYSIFSFQYLGVAPSLEKYSTLRVQLPAGGLSTRRVWRKKSRGPKSRKGDITKTNSITGANSITLANTIKRLEVLFSACWKRQQQQNNPFHEEEKIQDFGRLYFKSEFT